MLHISKHSTILNSWTITKTTISSIQSLSHVLLFATPWTAAPQASLSIAQLPESIQTHVHWVSDAIQPSHPLSSPSPPALQYFPASGSFPMSQLFTSGGQNIGVSASASVLPMNTQDWSPLGWTGWISLQSKGLSRVFYVLWWNTYWVCFSLKFKSWGFETTGRPLHSFPDFFPYFFFYWNIQASDACMCLIPP